MANELDEQSLLMAYEGRPDLLGAIRNAAAVGPQYVELFNYISAHIISLISEPISTTSNGTVSRKRKHSDDNEPVESKRDAKKDGQLTPLIAENRHDVLLEVDGISFVVPQRKKFTLCFTEQHLYARLRNEQIAGTRVAWKDIEYAFLLPIPEKSQKQHGFLLFPRNSCGLFSKKTASDIIPLEPIVFTVPSSNAPKPNTISGNLSHTISAVSDDYVTLLTWVLKERLKATGNNINIVSTDEKLFSSALKQPHRPNEKAVWVRAFRGSKEGYLFFLPIGILWTFKKPLLFLPHKSISAISFTNVLTRTFNLSMEISIENTDSADNEDNEEIEFSMLDQEDFENVNRYVNRYGLLDQSMTEQHKAKVLNINAVKNESSNNVSDTEPSELEKVGLREGNSSTGLSLNEQQMMDEDEEEEEDYDPGSEGESEGSGSSSEEEENIDEGNENEGDSDVNEV